MRDLKIGDQPLFSITTNVSFDRIFAAFFQRLKDLGAPNQPLKVISYWYLLLFLTCQTNVFPNGRILSESIILSTIAQEFE